jgi:hypothetical protein
VRRLYLVPCFLAAAVACSAPARAFAQDDKKPPPNPDVVTVDLKARTFSGTLPFDQAFEVRGAVDTATDAIVLRYGVRSMANEDANVFVATPKCAVWVRQAPLQGAAVRAPESHFVLDLPSRMLRANNDYLFEFSLYELKQPGSLGQPADDDACMGPVDIAAPSAATTIQLTEVVSIRGDTDMEFTQWFDTDIGFMYAHGAGYKGVASGVHFFLRPVNKKLDLAELGALESIPYRLTPYLGLAVDKLGGGRDVEPAWTVGSPMLGLGFRGPLYWSEDTPLARMNWILRPIRLNTGIVWFRQDDPNPLVDDKILKHDWFWSITADVDLTTILGPFVALLPG